MSVLIKGMDMSKHAIKNGTDDTLYRSCVIVHPDGTAEMILDSTFADMFGFEHNLNRFSLVKVPSPHGDLVDKNRIIYELCGSNMPEIYRDFCRRVLTDNTLTPTIIEAEE